VAKAYRLLRAIFNTALDDGLIRRNPCRIKGADRENSPERPVLTVAQVYALADAVGLRYRALILLAAFTSLRWAELAALTPADIDLDARTVRVTRQLYYHEAGYSFRPPKSRAGVRVVAFPELIVSDVRKHLDWLPASAALVFASSTGSPLSHSNFRHRVWLPALAAVGLEGIHMLSRPGARFRCCHRPVSPDRSPNPPCRSPGSGLSTVPAVRRGSQETMGPGSCSPGRRSG